MSVETLTRPGFCIGFEGGPIGLLLPEKEIRDNQAVRLSRSLEGSNSLSLFIAVPMAGGSIIVPFVQDGKKNVTVLKPQEKGEGDDQFVWERKISIFHASRGHFSPELQNEDIIEEKVPSMNGLYYTRYPDNLVKVAKITKNGKIEIWEVAVISQGGDFFLTVQLLYEAQAFTSENAIKIPAFDQKWPQLSQIVRQVITTLNLQLETESTSQQQIVEENLADGLSVGEGRVVWYNAANGVGAIILADGTQARVYWKEAPQRPLGRHYLVKGEKVAYSQLKTPEVDPYKRQTGFKKEAVGVTLIES